MPQAEPPPAPCPARARPSAQVPGGGGEEEAVKKAAAEVLHGELVSQQRQRPREQVEKDVPEGQVAEGLHCGHSRCHSSPPTALPGASPAPPPELRGDCKMALPRTLPELELGPGVGPAGGPGAPGPRRCGREGVEAHHTHSLNEPVPRGPDTGGPSAFPGGRQQRKTVLLVKPQTTASRDAARATSPTTRPEDQGRGPAEGGWPHGARAWPHAWPRWLWRLFQKRR